MGLGLTPLIGDRLDTVQYLLCYKQTKQCFEFRYLNVIKNLKYYHCAISAVSLPVSSATGSGASTPGAPNLDWAVPQQTRMKYLSTFQQTKDTKSNFSKLTEF